MTADFRARTGRRGRGMRPLLGGAGPDLTPARRRRRPVARDRAVAGGVPACVWNSGRYARSYGEPTQRRRMTTGRSPGTRRAVDAGRGRADRQLMRHAHDGALYHPCVGTMQRRPGGCGRSSRRRTAARSRTAPSARHCRTVSSVEPYAAPAIRRSAGRAGRRRQPSARNSYAAGNSRRPLPRCEATDRPPTPTTPACSLNVRHRAVVPSAASCSPPRHGGAQSAEVSRRDVTQRRVSGPAGRRRNVSMQASRSRRSNRPYGWRGVQSRPPSAGGP